MPESVATRRVAGEIVRDISATDPHLLHAVGLGDVLDEACAGATVPSRIRGASNGFVRLAEGHRSVYRTNVGPAGGVLAVKGAEPVLDDFGELLHWLRWSTFRAAPQHAHMPAIDHFPLVEWKVPGCVTLDEAVREFDTAAALQRAHLDRFGEPARLPVPLVVHRLPDRVAHEVGELVALAASPAGVRRTKALLDGGLAVLTYYYPTVPQRAGVVARRRPGESEAARVERLRALDPETVIARWARLFARLLLLGHLPYTFQNEGLGALFDPGNAVVDGGFVDVDSVVPVKDLGDDDGAVHDAVAGSLLGLVRTATLLLPAFNHAETVDLLVRRYVTSLVDAALRDDTDAAHLLHPAVSAFLHAATYEDVLTVLSSRARFTTAFV